jgi:hypothetical protein
MENGIVKKNSIFKIISNKINSNQKNESNLTD